MRRRPYRSPWESRWGLAQILAVGLLVSLVSLWALVHHCMRVMPPLRVPVPPANAATDAGEIAAPELVESDQ